MYAQFELTIKLYRDWWHWRTWASDGTMAGAAFCPARGSSFSQWASGCEWTETLAMATRVLSQFGA